MTPSWVAEWRQADPERYAWSLFFPAEVREAVWAIYVLSFELSRIPDLVSEEMLGLIRLAWWRERLDALYDGKPAGDHPLLPPLGCAIASFPLPRIAFDRQIEARSEQLAAPVIPGETVFHRFALSTSGMPAMLAQLTIRPDDEESRLMQEVGALYGKIALWWECGRHGLSLLPLATLTENGIDPLAGRPDEKAWRACLAQSVETLRKEHVELASEKLTPHARLLHGLSKRRLVIMRRRDPRSPDFPHYLSFAAIGLTWNALFTFS